MSLPEKASDYLPHALLALKALCGWIHCCDFEHVTKSDDAVQKVTEKVAEKLRSLSVTLGSVSGRVVRSIGPNWHQVVLDIAIKPQVGKFNK